MRTACSSILLLLAACGGAGAPSPSPSSPSNPSSPSPPSPSPSPIPSPNPNPTPTPTPAPTPIDHTRCGWIGAGDLIGAAAFVAHAAEYQFVHPDWFRVEPDGVNVRAVGTIDLPSLLQAAQAHGVKVTPLIANEDAARLRLMFNDPARRAAHVQTLVKLVHDHGYAGVDIDYEHLWTAADRPGFTAFMQELGAALHAAGAQLSMAIPAIGADDGASAYDYAALGAACDVVHVMGYDFHWIGSDHLGPIAPLGWIDSVFAHAKASGYGGRFLLGVANYAIGNNWFTTARDAAARCTAPPATTTQHMASCPLGHLDAGRALSCPTAQGELWFEDVASMEEKIATAQKYGARGVTYWTIGDELDGYYAMVRRHYP